MKENIVLIEMPFTFYDDPLCPLEQVSIDSLKYVSYLKSQDNRVTFVSMRSTKRYIWRTRRAGADSGGRVKMWIASKPQVYLRTWLKKLPRVDSFILLLNFSFSPYTFDIDVVRSISEICQECHPAARIEFTGDFIELFPKFISALNGNRLEYPIMEIDEHIPDPNALRRMDYGLFQLVRGCPNSCSFCVTARTPYKLFDVETVIGYMQQLYDKFSPSVFWNWDPNVLLASDHLIKFLDAYDRSGMKAQLTFSLGFQPDLLSDDLINRLSRFSFDIITLPFETGTVESKKNIGKPYSIISSIKKLYEIGFKARLSVNRLQCSFVIGFDHDDIHSIFRIYLSILKLKAVPLPFPLYLFPNTREFNEHEKQLSRKSMTELNGNLWPLVPDEKLEAYQNLLKFLLIPDLETAISNDHLLSTEYRSIFYDELKKNTRFVKSCLAVKADSVKELRDLEARLDSSSENVLYVVVNPKKQADSVSNTLGEYFIDKLCEWNDSVEVERINLYDDGLTFIDSDFIDFIYKRKKVEQVSPNTRRMLSLTDGYIEKLQWADKIVISTPMWTMSIPAILKSFFESIASRLYYEKGELLHTTPTCCILTRDGIYSGPDEVTMSDKFINVQESMLMTALDFIGVGRKLKFITAEGLYDPVRRREIVVKAKQEINDFVMLF